ncbi:TetR/AcrR family transcriptional regulator C-terminal domain-containing protein [Herbiconiux moechotypicola]|nr:TetR/AcrR family transcriptional regulator C-terminal domain-containing protein [Herbiconiux moechotypicola]MCS5730855.1 TetR/AcrR family transcriptional regulator C-terminal domain-containing protein [Herbiconiux moechotypicola]
MTRQPLDRSRVIEAAVERADREGLESISMRSLAAGLGVVPMALYKHVAGRDDLVAAMIDSVVEAYAPPRPGLGWQDAVRARIHSARAGLLAHPWLRTAIESATVRTPAVLGHMDAVAGELLHGGLSPDLAHHAMHALGHRIWGFSPEAFSAPPAGDAASPSAASAGLAHPDPAAQAELARQLAERFPNVVAIALSAAERTPTGACDDDAEFDFTLDLLLDAFERLHRARWESRPVVG